MDSCQEITPKVVLWLPFVCACMCMCTHVCTQKGKFKWAPAARLSTHCENPSLFFNLIFIPLMELSRLFDTFFVPSFYTQRWNKSFFLQSPAVTLFHKCIVKAFSLHLHLWRGPVSSIKRPPSFLSAPGLWIHAVYFGAQWVGRAQQKKKKAFSQ